MLHSVSPKKDDRPDIFTRILFDNWRMSGRFEPARDNYFAAVEMLPGYASEGAD